MKCFTRDVPGQRDRYRNISEHLARANLPFTVDFQYMESGIRVGAEWYPALKMRWVEGLTLNLFVQEHLERPANLKMLLELWVKLSTRLREKGIAHADLQHGNVLLVPQDRGHFALRLIDYDGMFVPSLASSPSGEAGHSAYQHPQRRREGAYNAEVDRFSHLAIYTAIHALQVDRGNLWQRFNNDDNLLFREPDFREPRKSDLFHALWETKDPALKAMVGRLILACHRPLEEAPLLDSVVANGKVRPLGSGEMADAARLLSAAVATAAVAQLEPAAPASALGSRPTGAVPLFPAGSRPAPTAFPSPPPLPPAMPSSPTLSATADSWNPILAVDRLLKSATGEGNGILHNFLRGTVGLACAAVVAGLIWLVLPPGGTGSVEVAQPTATTPEVQGKPASFELTIEPPDAEVIVVGLDARLEGVGKNRKLVFAEPSGQRNATVTVKLEGYDTVERVLRPMPGEVTRTTIQLTPAPAVTRSEKPPEESIVEQPNVAKLEMAKPDAELKPDVKPEPETKPDSPKQPTPEQLIQQQMAAARAAAEEQQRHAAERRTEWQNFAKKNGGVLIENIPFDQGIAELPVELIDNPVNPPELYLGAGRVLFKNRKDKWQEFAFGETFREQPAGTKGQEVPELAEAVGFESVSVHVAVDPKEKKPKLMLRAAPKSASEVDKNDIQRLQKQINSLGALLRKRPPANSEMRANWEEEVMSYCGIALPEYPPDVNRNDPRFRNDPQGLTDANFDRERARREVEEKRRRILKNLEKVADEKRKEWGSQITKLEADASDQKNQRRDAEQKALSDFYSRCAKITALVYRSGRAKNAAGAATSNAEIFSGAAVEGYTHESEKFVPFDDFVAQVRPEVLDPSGKRLPPAGDLKTPGRVQCQVIERRDDGQEIVREIAGRAEFDAYRIRAGASAVSLRFRFWSSAGPVAGAAGQIVAESKWLQIEPIEAKKQYRLRFRLTDEEMARWRLLSARSHGG